MLHLGECLCRLPERRRCRTETKVSRQATSLNAVEIASDLRLRSCLFLAGCRPETLPDTRHRRRESERC
ncbi:hypothetical protein HMPREF1549_00505 [Actinomyces johnsonii F0510]|uniref:Uncharacterized protein n=1 Tax=Actinomyces johnsonii F0510 TaxID=1227262 RepID=U1QIL3_9ACTO|nr:hypothetical protein HMPREF1549_00505 [Actinomyces johnsonii F0510]